MHPRIQGPLSSNEIRKIDRAARQILKRTGIRIQDPQFLGRLKAAGVQADLGRQRAYFSSSWLEEHLAKAPSRFILYSRNGENDIHLGDGRVHFANGGRVFRVFDAKRGEERLSTSKDIACTASLVDHLEYIQIYIISCQAHDLEPENYHLNDFFQALNHTAKHVMGGCDNLHGATQMWDLARNIAGGEAIFKEKPFASVITNPMSPLSIDSETLYILEFCSRKGIPVTCAPAPISGATAPATLAGTLAQMHAEALVGVVLTQFFAPGAKVLYGAVPSAMDLRSMDYTMGSVEMALMNAAAVQLAKTYRLPIYASAGVTEAKESDIQAGLEKSLSNLIVALNGADLIHLAAGMLDSGNSIAYEQYVIDNEILGMIRRVLNGITVDHQTIGLEVIDSVGPGGNFVMEEHTVAHMMTEFFYPQLSVRCNFDIWEERKRPTLLSRSQDMVKQIIDDNPRERLDPETLARLKKTFPRLKIKE